MDLHMVKSMCFLQVFFKPKVVLYGGFSEFVYSNFRSKITLKILCFVVCSVRPASPWVLHVSPFCTWVLHVSPYYAFLCSVRPAFPWVLHVSPKSLIWRDFYIFGDLTNILCRYKGNTSHTNYIRFMGEFTRVG